MIAAKSSQTSDISPFIAAENTALIITASIRGFHKHFLTLSERLAQSALTFKYLPPPLRAFPLHAQPPRPLKRLVLPAPSLNTLS